MMGRAMKNPEWAAYMRRYREKMSPYQRQITRERQMAYQRRLYQRRLEEGVCVICGKPRMEGDNRLCEIHRAKEKARRR